MRTRLDLKAVERKAWRSIFSDGLWDIYLGLILLVMGINELLEYSRLTPTVQSLIYIFLLALSITALWAGKRYITLPRMGLVRFSKEREAARGKVRFFLFIVVLLGLIGWVLAANEAAPGASQIFPVLYVLILMALFGAGAYLLDYPRLLWIGVMYALPVPLRLLFERMGISPLLIHYAIPAGVILATGLIHLVRFLRRYPVLPSEENHA